MKIEPGLFANQELLAEVDEGIDAFASELALEQPTVKSDSLLDITNFECRVAYNNRVRLFSWAMSPLFSAHNGSSAEAVSLASLEDK